MAKMNLRDQILNAKDQEEEVVTIKQWGVKVLVKGLNGAERDALLQNSLNQKTGVTDFKKMNTALVIASCFDPETDEKVFEDQDADMIAKKSAGALSRIVQVASKLSGLDEEALGESEKN